MKKTAAIIVSYNPDLFSLHRLALRCSNGVDYVFIVDNGSVDDNKCLIPSFPENVRLYPLHMNFGIAYAQNYGISIAREFGIDFVAFFDQDSNLEITTLPNLIFAINQLIDSGANVACVGPRYIDKRQNNPIPFIRVKGLTLERISPNSDNDIVPVDHLISSGSVIPMKTFDAVGVMKELLFIDYVDLEWCERAKFMGYQSYGVCAAAMEHELGDEPIRFMGTAYPARSPLRHYYMFRNAIWMYRQSYVRFNWKCVDGLRLLRKYVFYTLFAKPRHVHFWMMTKGMLHGLFGVMGRYQ